MAPPAGRRTGHTWCCQSSYQVTSVRPAGAHPRQGGESTDHPQRHEASHTSRVRPNPRRGPNQYVCHISQQDYEVMNLSEWAKLQGIHPQTAYRWFREGALPVPARQIGRLILVGDLETSPSTRGSTVIYARVSSADQRADLDRQVSRVGDDSRLFDRSRRHRSRLRSQRQATQIPRPAHGPVRDDDGGRAS